MGSRHRGGGQFGGLARACLVGTVAAVVLAPTAAAEKDEPTNLLRLPGARVVSTTAPGGQTKDVEALADGDSSTAASVEASADAPLDVVWDLGQEAAPQEVRVAVPAGADAAARVEVLVSTASPHAGFRSVRSDPLEPGAKNAFRFRPVGARFLLVRLSPARGRKAVSAAEVEVAGHVGPPRSRYEFAESPARALDVLERLRASSAVSVPVGADERALFARAEKGRLDAKAFAEAALLASGVSDRAQRARYLARLDALEAEARTATAGARTPTAKGEALLRWLHRGPLSKGYVAEQTDLSRALDTGTFNCVSSAVLYNAIALRLGLDARAIEVPTHAFSILYEGTRHADVETTTPEGFDPARDPAKAEGFERLTGFRYLPDSYRDQRREVEEAGLAAIVHYNHGVALSREKRWHEALLAFFRAMSLDREFASAVKGALGVLASWGLDLAERGEPERALEVLETGLSLAPEDATLRHDRLYVWQTWAERAIDAGKPSEALAILERAARAVPDGGFAERRAWVFVKPGERLADAGRYEEAFAGSAGGLGALEGKAREELLEWRVGLWHRWFAQELRAGRHEEAAEVLEKALRAVPGDPGVLRNAGYLTQEWSGSVAKDDAGRSVEVARKMVARFPGVEDVAEAASNRVRRAAGDLVEAGRFEEALALADGARDLLGGGDAERETGVFVHDRWAKARMEAGAWEDAADVYRKALVRWPGERLLEGNAAYLAQEWGKAAYAKGGAAEAARVAKRIAEAFPGLARVGQAGANALRGRVESLVDEAKWAEALAALDEGRALLGSEGDAKVDDVYVSVYDRWARAEIEAGRFDGAAEAYRAGLARFPKHRGLRQNVGWVAQEWAKAEAEKGDAAAAAAALRTMLGKFPDSAEVKEAARSHVGREATRLAEEGKPEEALALVDAQKDLAGAEGAATATRTVFDRWAREHADAERWQEAVDVYAKGLARMPADAHLVRNAKATWYRWAKTLSDAKDWDGAVAVYDRALERFPKDRVFEGNRKYCLEQKAKGGG